ncbi:hypothetical protein T02_3666 [Trichinella nativa]|uniref:Uncharacterized protein n=1 Tax=Trichinella nativa TaxID=6335 RepID=A0A0V1KPY3_9BILA|nr:hypothetical protein T02_3666 [Trichinella nativa]
MHPRCAINFILSIFELPKISDDSEPTEAIRVVLLQLQIFAGLYSGRQFKTLNLRGKKIDARVITIITNPLFVNVIRRNKRNELLEKFSFNTILLMMMMIMVEHLDKLVNLSRIFECFALVNIEVTELYAFVLSLLALYRACMHVVMFNGNNGQESISSIIGRRIEERTHWKE